MDTYEDTFSLSALLDDPEDDHHPVAADFEIPEEFGRTSVPQNASPISSSSSFRVSDFGADTQFPSGGQVFLESASSSSNIVVAPCGQYANPLPLNNSSQPSSICESTKISEKNSLPSPSSAFYEQNNCNNSLRGFNISKESSVCPTSELCHSDLPVANEQLSVTQSRSDGNLFSVLDGSETSLQRMTNGGPEYLVNKFIPASPNSNSTNVLHSHPPVNGHVTDNLLFNNFQSTATIEQFPVPLLNGVSGDGASRSSSTCSNSQQLQTKSSWERVTPPFDVPASSPLTNGNYSASEHSAYDSRNISRNPSPVGEKCSSCTSLKKKLSNSKQWNKFLKEKLIITDKLFQRADDLERDNQRYLELQLAYDQRTREWRYQQDQLVQLLQEVQPLKEKLAEVEKELAMTKKLRTESDMSKHALQVSCEQYKARIDALSAKVNPINQEIMEKKLQRKMGEIRRLRTEMEMKNTAIHDMKAYIKDHKLFCARQSKKCLWALEMACKLSADDAEGHPYVDEETRSRLQSALWDTRNTLTNQYEAFRRTSERQLEGDILGLSLLPSFEQWLDDFDHEGHSQWEFDSDDEVKSLYKTEKTKKKRLDSESATYRIEFAKSTPEDTQKSKSDLQQGTEPQKVKKKRGPYKKKTPEEKRAIKMAGAKIEQLLMDITESKNNNSHSRDSRNESASESSPEKSMSKETKEPKNNIMKTSKVQASLTAASDSDEFIDCPSPFDNRFMSTPSKQSQSSDARSVGADIRNSSTNRALPTQSNSVDVRREQPFVVSEKSLFGDDSSDGDSDAESSTKKKTDCFSKDDRSRSQPSESPAAIPSSDKKTDRKEQRFNSKPSTTKEGSLPIGRSIHGVAKVGRVFDRQVVSGCAKKGLQQQPLRDEPIKLGATKKPANPSYNVKEIGNLMRESMKEKQKVLTSGSKTSSRVLPSTSVDDVPIICKRRAPAVIAPVKSKPSANSSHAASHRILSMEEKSLTKYKPQNKDPSMFSSSDSSDSESVSHSPVKRSGARSPVKSTQNSAKSLKMNESERSSSTNQRVSGAMEPSKSSYITGTFPVEESAEVYNRTEIEHCKEVSKASRSLDVSKTCPSARLASPVGQGAKVSFSECNQSNTIDKTKSPQKFSESTKSQPCELNLHEKEPAENFMEENTVPRTSSLTSENIVTKITTNLERRHSDDQRAILSDDLAMSSDSDDEDNNDCLRSTAGFDSPLRRAIRVEDNLSDSSPERPVRPSSLPLCSESPAKERIPFSPSQRTSEAEIRFGISSKSDASSKTSTPVKDSACTTSPLDISDVVKCLSLDDSLAADPQVKMVESDIPRCKIPNRPGSASERINRDNNERVASIFDDEDSCLTPTASKPLASQVPDSLGTSNERKVPTAFAGLNLSLTDDEVNDSDVGESGNMRSSSGPPELAAERYSWCDDSESNRKSTTTDKPPAVGTSNDGETLEDAVFVNVDNNDENSSSAADSPMNEGFSNSEVASDEKICRENASSHVNSDAGNFSEGNPSPVGSPVSGVPGENETLEKSVSCPDPNEHKSLSKESLVNVCSSNLESNSEQSVEKVAGFSKGQDLTKEITHPNACVSGEVDERRISKEARSPSRLDTRDHSGALEDEGKSLSPVGVRGARVRRRSSSSVSSRRCSSSVDSKADHGSPHSYGLRKRVSSHDSGNESTPSKAASAKRLRKHSGRNHDTRCPENSFGLCSPSTDTPAQVLDTERVSAEPSSKGRITRRTSSRKMDKESIRSIFDALKSPSVSGKTQDFDFPSDIGTHTSLSSFNKEQNEMSSDCSASKESSQSIVRSLSSPATYEYTCGNSPTTPPVPSKDDEAANNRVRFLPPVIVQTRRSSRQRRCTTFSSPVSRSIAKLKNVPNSDLPEVKSISAQIEDSMQSDNEESLSENTRDSSHAPYSVSSKVFKPHQKCVTPNDFNTSITSEDDAEMTSSSDKKAKVLVLESGLDTYSVQSDLKGTNSSVCVKGVTDSTLPRNTVSKGNGEVAPSDVQKPSKDRMEVSQSMRVEHSEKEEECTVNKPFRRIDSSRVSNFKTSIPLKLPCDVDPTSRVTRRRKAMVFKSTKRTIVGTPPRRRTLNQNAKQSLSPHEVVSSGCVDATAPISERGKEKLTFSDNSPILSPQKSDVVDAQTGSHEGECCVADPNNHLGHSSRKPHAQNDASKVKKSFIKSSKISEENKAHNSTAENDCTSDTLSSTESVSIQSKSCKKVQDKHVNSTESTLLNSQEPDEIDSDSPSLNESLEINVSISCINEVDDSESEGEMFIHVDEIESEPARPAKTTRVSPASDAPDSSSSVSRVETNKNLGLFGEDESSSLDEDVDEKKKQSSLVQGKRKRLHSEPEAPLELTAEISKSKCDPLENSEPRHKKRKPSLTETVPSASLETKSKVINSATRQTIGKKGSFSTSQLQELERRKLTASKTAHSLTPISNVRGLPVNNRLNERVFGGRASSNSANEIAKTQGGDGTIDARAAKSKVENGTERKKAVNKEKKPLAKRTARLSKSAAAAATAAARRTMTGQRPMASHLKRSVPSPDDSSSDELNVKRTPGKSSLLIESDSEPEASFGTEQPSKVRKTCKERVTVNGNKCLDLNSVVQNLAQKSVLAKKSSILLERKSTVKTMPFVTKSPTPVSSLDKPSANYTGKETKVCEKEHLKKLKTECEPKLSSYLSSESCTNTSVSRPHSVSAATSQLKDVEKNSDDESALQVDLGSCGSSVRFYDAEETRSTKVGAVNAQAELNSGTKPANSCAIKRTKTEKDPSYNTNAVSVSTNVKMRSASDCNRKSTSGSFTATDNHGKRVTEIGSEKSSNRIPSVDFKPISFYGKDLLMSPDSDDDEQMNELDCSQDSLSTSQELYSIPPTSTDSSEYCPVMRVPSIPTHLTSSLEKAQSEYCAILGGLEDIRFGSREWKTCVVKIVQDVRKRLKEDSSVPASIYLQPLARAFIESIICVDPIKNLTGNFRILCPELYKLFMLVKVIENNLNGVPAHSLEDLITCLCENLIRSSGFTGASEKKEDITLCAAAVASLCSWHTASCCVAKKDDRKPQWRRTRAFIVSLLCHYPGLAHGALLSSLFLGRFVLLRLVKYRSTTGLERVIMWLVHHGAWIGKSSVRALLIDNMNAWYACENSPAEPMVLVRSVLETLLNKVDKNTKARLYTSQNLKITVLGLLVLSCWKGKAWLLNELLPFVVRLLACKTHVTPSSLCECIVSITCALLPRVGVQNAEIAELLQNTEEEGGAALFAAAEYKDPKLKPDSILLSKILGALADALRKLLHDDSS